MAIDFTNVINSTHQYANNAINYVANTTAAKTVDSARDTAYDFLNATLPESVTSTALSISQAINNNTLVQTVESYVGSPAQICATAAGFGAGRAIAVIAPGSVGVSLTSAAIAGIVAIALTSSRTDVAVVGLTTTTSFAISFARRAVGF